jgi:hypothetical protein
MTKIALYGDSFASDYEGWPSHFEKLMKSDVTIFSKPGTSVGYSYLKFLETHDQYDIVYFFWTHSDRNWLISSTNDSNNCTLQHNASFIPLSSKDPDSHTHGVNKDYIVVDSKNSHEEILYDWIQTENHCSDLYPNKNLLSVLSMRDSVKYRRPDSFTIETFDFYVPNKSKITSESYILKFYDFIKTYKNDNKISTASNCIPGMWRIELQDMIQYSSKWLNDISYIRRNHLTETQNKEFARYLFASFKNKEIDIHKTFKYPNKYYTMSKNIEESGFIL